MLKSITKNIKAALWTSLIIVLVIMIVVGFKIAGIILAVLAVYYIILFIMDNVPKGDMMGFDSRYEPEDWSSHDD